MLGSKLDASDGGNGQRRTKRGENVHTLPMVCDMLLD